MANTQVLLTEPIPGLGFEADIVKVKAGYARNYLIPSGKAWEVSPGTLRRVNALKARRAEREARELNDAQEIARRINKLKVTMILETGESGKAFGAVTATDIASKLKGELGGKEVDRHRIVLEHPIKSTGAFEVPIKLHADVTATLNLTVKPSKEPEQPAEGDAEEAEGKEARRPRRTRSSSSEAGQ